MPAARFELAAHVNVHQPDSQQNKNPSPRQPDAIRDETVTLTTAAHWLRCLRSSKSACKAQRGQNSNARWRVCVPFAYLESDDVLASTICSTSDGLALWAMRVRGENFNCGVSSSGNVKVWHGPRASQPVRNRSRTQTSSIATASK